MYAAAASSSSFFEEVNNLRGKDEKKTFVI